MALKSSSVNSAIKEGNLQKRSNGDYHSVIGQVRQLAWLDQHTQSIELATEELGMDIKRSTITRMDLLDLRAESPIAQVRLDLAAKDARNRREVTRAIQNLSDQSSIHIIGLTANTIHGERISNSPW
jgi:hypothetical protein